MKPLQYIVFTLAIVAVFITPDSGVIISGAFPLWLIPVLGTALQAGGNQMAGNPRNVRKNRREDLKQTTQQADQLYNSMLGKVSGNMDGIDQALKDLGLQYADLKGLDKQFGSALKKSYLDTTEGQAIMNKINQNTEKSKNKLRNDASLMNLSEESYVAGLGKINEAEGQATGNLAANANANRANLRGSMMNLKNMMGANASTRGGMNLNKANFKSNLYGNSFNAASGIMNQTDQRMQNAMNSFSQGIDGASSAILQALMAGG